MKSEPEKGKNRPSGFHDLILLLLQVALAISVSTLAMDGGATFRYLCLILAPLLAGAPALAFRGRLTKRRLRWLIYAVWISLFLAALLATSFNPFLSPG